MTHVIETLKRWTHIPHWQSKLAMEAADEAVALATDGARALHARAHVALIDEQHVTAYLGFRAALRLNPAMSRARLRLAVIELEIGHPERVAPHVTQALRDSPFDEVLRAQAFFISAMASFHLWEECTARRQMEEVLSVRPPESGFAHQWIAAIDALAGIANSSYLAALERLVPGHTLASLRATERSSVDDFIRQRVRFTRG